jgi:hypothetical protein
LRRGSLVVILKVDLRLNGVYHKGCHNGKGKGFRRGYIGSVVISGSATATAVEVVKPQPRVENVVATTSGSPSAYYATLDIKIKNVGAEGTVLVQAAVTQNGKTSSNEMPVFLKKNETHELKLTFPLVWQGGDFTSSVKTIVP